MGVLCPSGFRDWLTWTVIADGTVVAEIDTPNASILLVALEHDWTLGRNAIVPLLDVKGLESGGCR